MKGCINEYCVVRCRGAACCARDEARAAESSNVFGPLIIDYVRVRPNLVKTILEFEGAANFPLDKVTDPILVEEVLQQSKGAT